MQRSLYREILRLHRDQPRGIRHRHRYTAKSQPLAEEQSRRLGAALPAPAPRGRSVVLSMRSTMPQICIVDYGMGNLLSVTSAFQRLGYYPTVGATPEAIKQADALVLPGVGAFPEAMRR